MIPRGLKGWNCTEHTYIVYELENIWGPELHYETGRTCEPWLLDTRAEGSFWFWHCCKGHIKKYPFRHCEESDEFWVWRHQFWHQCLDHDIAMWSRPRKTERTGDWGEGSWSRTASCFSHHPPPPPSPLRSEPPPPPPRTTFIHDGCTQLTKTCRLMSFPSNNL